MNAGPPSEENFGADAAADAQPAAAEGDADISPGVLLSRARQARGLSIADVARTIKFSPKQIEAIESDDLDPTSASTTFIRGFIRSYAKLLHIDPQPLLAMLEQPAPQVDDMIQLPQDGGTALPQPIEEPRITLPRWLLPALLAIAAAAAGLIWHLNASDRGVDLPVVRAPDPPSAPPVAPAAVSSGGGDVVSSPSVNPNVEPLPAGSGAASQTFAGSISAPAPALAQPGPPAAPGSHQLVFTFTGKSWVEVRDATQAVLLSQNSDAGSRQVVSGKPPFALVIGSAPNVRLQYDEREIDLQPYTRVDVARLNLE